MEKAPNRDFQSDDETTAYAMPAGDENHHSGASPTELIEGINTQLSVTDVKFAYQHGSRIMSITRSKQPKWLTSVSLGSRKYVIRKTKAD